KSLINLAGKALVTMVLAAGSRAENGVYNRQYRFDQRQMVHYL
ncbi:MAG TPA: nitroreductase family protein, partial [Marinobacter adhaerens]|nr:nitroreductase family protein [Marinobacter adhaerens]